MTGIVYGVGVGPGDPELLTLKAARLIRSADLIAYPAPEEGPSFARQIAAPHIPADMTELPIRMNIGDGRFPKDDVYDDAARTIAQAVQSGKQVTVLCEGDPFFYGSFMHLYARLRDRVAIDVIAGIPGMAGCWNAVGQPIALGDDVMTVLMGTLPEEELQSRMRASDALVIMKTGRNLQKVRRALEVAGRLGEAWLIERGTMPGERVTRLADVDATECPYFAIVLVHGQGRRPECAE